MQEKLVIQSHGKKTYFRCEICNNHLKIQELRDHSEGFDKTKSWSAKDSFVLMEKGQTGAKRVKHVPRVRAPFLCKDSTHCLDDSLMKGQLRNECLESKTSALSDYLFGVLRRFQHCTGHITTGSWKDRGNQYI